MKYLLDSNTISDFYEVETNDTIISRLERLKTDDVVYISMLSLYEFEYRFANAPEDIQPQIRKQIIAMLNDFELISLSETGAKIFGCLKKKLSVMRGIKPENLKKHNMDLMLAANAISMQAVIVSADGLYVDLKKLEPRLNYEDWTVQQVTR